MKWLFLVFFSFLPWVALAANDSTLVKPISGSSGTNATPMYWSCTNTKRNSVSRDSGMWWGNASAGEWGGGERVVACADAGGNPTNAMPSGMRITPSGSSPSVMPGQERLTCTYLTPVCGWVKGPAPGTAAPAL